MGRQLPVTPVLVCFFLAWFSSRGMRARQGVWGTAVPQEEAVAWQPRQQRGQSGGDASPAAALTGPLQAALTGVPLRPSEREPCPHGAAARRALAAWHEAERQPGGDAVSAAALTRRRLPRCQRPAPDAHERASGPLQPR
jgi:hypothetical protein